MISIMSYDGPDRKFFFYEVDRQRKDSRAGRWWWGTAIHEECGMHQVARAAAPALGPAGE